VNLLDLRGEIKRVRISFTLNKSLPNYLSGHSELGILVPRLFSFPFSREKKTLVGAGHVALNIKYD
jgi:hypothetical protein